MSSTKIKEAKSIIWDLDNTLWKGTLAESDEVILNHNVATIIHELDGRGILHSISSKNNHAQAMAKLAEFGLDHFFLYPEINWNAKSASVRKIRENLNIGMDTMMFIDDQEFEREEVRSVHPEVECLDVTELHTLLGHARLNPRYITEDSAKRRQMYLEDIRRTQEEETFEGPKEAFLASLDMKFQISQAAEYDLQRAEELTVRTNQLNSTGRTYSYDELDAFRRSKDHKLLVCELSDRFGSYGKIGLALVELSPEYWHVKMLLMSCRVISRGVGTVFLTHIMHEAKKNGKRLRADFRPTDRNRMMYLTYKFANFREAGMQDNDMVVLENDLSLLQKYPPSLEVLAAY